MQFKFKIGNIKKFIANLKTRQQKLNFESILIHSISFGAALFVSTSILFYFGLAEGQWLLWSTLSVMQFEIKESLVKSWRRLKGAFIGGGLAFILCIIIPHTQFITLFFFILLPFTLVMFTNYTVAFAARSACVVLGATSIDVSHYLFQYRLENVLIGACVGLCITLLVHLIMKRRLR